MARPYADGPRLGCQGIALGATSHGISDGGAILVHNGSESRYPSHSTFRKDFGPILDMRKAFEMTPREKDIIFFALAGLVLLTILYLMIGYLVDGGPSYRE